MLGRLAVLAEWLGQAMGRGMLKDAVLRSLQACDQVGAEALRCHAIDESAKAFYLKHGSLASPIPDMTVMLPLRRRPPVRDATALQCRTNQREGVGLLHSQS